MGEFFLGLVSKFGLKAIFGIGVSLLMFNFYIHRISDFAIWVAIFFLCLGTMILIETCWKNKQKCKLIKNKITHLDPYEYDLLLTIYYKNEKYQVRDLETGNRQYHYYKSLKNNELVEIEELMNENPKNHYNTIKISITPKICRIIDKVLKYQRLLDKKTNEEQEDINV